MTASPDLEDDVLDNEETWEVPAELAPDEEASHHAVLDDRPIVVSAFAGIGGFDLGFERAGYQTGAVIEWDAAATRVLAARFPNAARFSDVRKVSGDAIRRALGGRAVDVLCGGFPCQDLSVAGRRAGMAGDRSGLYGELLRLAAEIRPRWLVVENVPGLLSADADPGANGGEGYGFGSGFSLFLGDVTGYRPPVPDGGWRNSGVCSGPLAAAAWRVLDARHFGVAQRRRRVFALVSLGDRAAPAAVLLEPEGVRWDLAAGRPSWARAAAAAVGAAVRGGGGGADGGGEGAVRPDLTPTWAPEVSVPLGALTGGQRQDLEGMTYVPVAAEVASTLRGSDGPHGVSWGLRGDGSDNLVPHTDEEATGGIQLYPDGNVGFEPHAATVMAAGNVNVVDGRQVGHVEAAGGDDVAPTVTSKWHKGSGGPAGSETGNLVVVGDGGTEVSHPVTASGTDGMGRGVPAVAFSGSDDGDDATEELAPTLRQAGQGHGQAAAVAHGGRHQPVVAEHRDGWAVYCDACSEEAGDYVYPCRTGRPFPPPVLLEPARAYVVDKERGLPNDEGIRVAEADVAPPLLADGDPAERTDRGTRVVQAYAPDDKDLVVAPALTAQMRNASGSLGHSGGDERVIAVLAAEQEALAFAEGKTGQSVADVAPTVQAAIPSDSSHRQQAVVTYRKARRAQTDQDDETWQEADYANTLNTFDGGDARATEVVVESPRVVDRHGHHGDAPGALTTGGANSNVPAVTSWALQPDPTEQGALAARPAPLAPTVTPGDHTSDRGARIVDQWGAFAGRPAESREVIGGHAAVRRLTPRLRECERLQGFSPVLVWRTDEMTRDELCAALLAGGWVTVDPETGTVWRWRGPGGHRLREPVEVPGSDGNGYRVATFKLDGERRQVRLHRLVWIAAYGIPEPGLAVCHRDDDKTNNRIGNLYLATREQNSTDAAATGRYRVGEDNGRAVLTNAESVQILDDYRAGDVTIRELATRYGVSKSRVGQIVRLRDWTLVAGRDGKPATDSPRYKQLGNAVCANVAEWIAFRIRAHDEGLLG